MKYFEKKEEKNISKKQVVQLEPKIYIHPQCNQTCFGCKFYTVS
jgi:hypothetical protein